MTRDVIRHTEPIRPHRGRFVLRYLRLVPRYLALGLDLATGEAEYEAVKDDLRAHGLSEDEIDALITTVYQPQADVEDDEDGEHEVDDWQE